MYIRARVFVSGKVQGVFFRNKTQVEAYRRNITGWIKNLPDGRVEAVFEGRKSSVDAIIEFCRRGPTGAQVTKVETKWESPTREYKTFSIRY